MLKNILNWTTNKKLNFISLVFLLSTALSLAVVGFFGTKISNSQEKKDEFSEVRFTVESIRVKYNVLRGDILTLLIIDPLKEVDQLKSTTESYDKTINEIRQLHLQLISISKKSPEMIEELDSFIANVNNLVSFCEKNKNVIANVSYTDTSFNSVRAILVSDFDPLFKKVLTAKTRLVDLIDKKTADESTQMENFKKLVIVLVILVNVIIMGFGFITSRFISSNITKSLAYVNSLLKRITDGELPEIQTAQGNDEINKSVGLLIKNLIDLKDFSVEVGKGNFANTITIFNNKGEIANALFAMKEALANAAETEGKQRWISQGIAESSRTMRNCENEISSLAEAILTFCVKYLNANQGSFFIVNEESQALDLRACYAYDRKKYITKSISFGEGLVGQVYLERDIIFLKDVPNNYVHITSGLGGANPSNIILVPLINNGNVQGVLEIASFKEFSGFQIDFLKQLAELVASDIANSKVNTRTQQLLDLSQQQTESMRAAEEELRQNMEEMQATQEEMKRKSDELSKASAEMAGIITGINTTMATIEFTPDGTVITANNNFLASTGYTLDKIKGRHHKLFVPKEIVESEGYKTFWTKLASGEAMTGIFKRVSSTGKTVWLNAIYNPILNANGDVVKVIKFATDITVQQEMLAESKGVISGINTTMATIEFTAEGIVVTANDNFLASTGYTLDKIKGKHHKLFVPKEIVESEEYKTFWTKLASGEAMTGIFKRVSSTGKMVWLNAIYNPILNANGDIVKVIKFATDITVQQEMLAENKGVIDGIDATMATIEFTPDGKVVTANNNFLASMDYTLDKIKGKHHKLFVPKEIVESEEYKTFWTKLASGEAMTGIFKRISSTGKTVWLNAIYNPILNANGDVVKVIKFATDITKEKEKEEEIHQLLEESKAQEEELRQNMEELATTQEEINRRQKESESILERFELSSQTTSDGLWDMVVPETLEFTNETPFFWTNKFRAMLGYKDETGFPNVLSSWSDLLHPDHKQKTLDAFTAHLLDFSGATPYDVEYQLKLNSGEYKWFRAIGKTLRDEKGKPKRVAGSLIDIQVVKDLEALKKVEKKVSQKKNLVLEEKLIIA